MSRRYEVTVDEAGRYVLEDTRTWEVLLEGDADSLDVVAAWWNGDDSPEGPRAWRSLMVARLDRPAAP